jgi:hypothetical protein
MGGGNDDDDAFSGIGTRRSISVGDGIDRVGTDEVGIS